VPERFLEALERRPHPHEVVFELSDARRLPEVVGWLLSAGVDLRAVTPQRGMLEELFLATTESWVEGSREQRRTA